MAYLFQTFSYAQVFTSAQANQLEENILKHEHGVTTNCSTLSLYGAKANNETITGQWTFNGGILQVGTTSGILTLGGAPTSNGSGWLQFINSSTLKNWAIGFNQISSGNLEFIPSVTNGGSTFTTPAMSITNNGDMTLLGNIVSNIRFTGTVNIGTTSGILTLGGAPTSNGSGWLQFVNSSTIKNWAIGFNQIISGNLEFIPSTANGGGTFTTPLVSFQPSGAPIVLGSTTMCTNLNADMVDGLHASSFYQDTAFGIADYIQVGRSVTNQTIGTTLTKLQFNSEALDPNARWDAVTNFNYTAPYTGIYHVSGNLLFGASVANDLFNINIYVNGASYRSFASVAPTADNHNFTFSTLVSCPSGQTIDIRANGSNASDTLVMVYSHLSIYPIKR